MLNIFFQVIIRSDYNPKLVMVAVIIGNVTNIVLDYLFVVEFNMGLKGASIATGLGPLVAFLFLMLHFVFKKNNIKIVKNFFDREILMEVLKNGSGSSILEFTSGSIIFIFNFILLRVSDSDAVAIYAIVSNIAFVSKSIFAGISQAAQPLISVNYGAKNFDRVKKSVNIALKVSIVTGLFAYLMIILFPEQIMSVFIGQYAHLMERATDILIIYFVSCVFTGINTTLMYYFQSTGNGKIATIIAISRGFILITIGLLIFTPFLGELGVWVSITFAEIVTLICILPIKKRYDKLLIERFDPLNDLTYQVQD